MPIVEVDLSRIERDRDQIWAEAAHLFKSGMKWWLTPDEERQADELTGERRVVEAWAGKIDDALKGMAAVTMDSVISSLQIPIGQQSDLTVKRIAEHLASVGYTQGRDRTWRRNGEAVQGEMI